VIELRLGETARREDAVGKNSLSPAGREPGHRCAVTVRARAGTGEPAVGVLRHGIEQHVRQPEAFVETRESARAGTTTR
jgi:hypothetical protein